MENIIDQHWIRWHPTEGLSEKYDLIYFSESNQEELKLILCEEKNKEKKIEVLVHYPDVFRITYDSFRYKTFDDMNYNYGYDFHVGWTFFKVHNSECIKWLSEESSTIIDPTKFIHYCIITSELIIDIVSEHEPKVQLLD